jgi:hypothetical protein
VTADSKYDCWITRSQKTLENPHKTLKKLSINTKKIKIPKNP